MGFKTISKDRRYRMTFQISDFFIKFFIAGIALLNAAPPSVIAQYKYPSLAIGILTKLAKSAGGGLRLLSLRNPVNSLHTLDCFQANLRLVFRPKYLSLRSAHHPFPSASDNTLI
jgi:hypothetical protein